MRASVCSPGASEYIIMTVPVVLWIPDLKGQRPFLIVQTLSQPLRLPAAMAEEEESLMGLALHFPARKTPGELQILPQRR